jgi:hypothetical protein
MVSATLDMSDDEYPIVHCRPAGRAPPVADMVRLRVTVEPGVPDPEPRDDETCCPLAWVVIRPASTVQTTTRSQPLDNEKQLL